MDVITQDGASQFLLMLQYFPGESAQPNFTFMLPRIVIDFFLNNQPDALIIQIYSVIKLYMFWDICSAHHQEFSTVHSALVSFMQVYDDRFQAESGWNCSSILTLLGSGHITE